MTREARNDEGSLLELLERIIELQALRGELLAAAQEALRLCTEERCGKAVTEAIPLLKNAIRLAEGKETTDGDGIEQEED